MPREECFPLLAATDLESEFARGPQSMRSRRDYLRDVWWLADLLPPSRCVLNFCHDRYRFLVGVGASLATNRVCLLPSTRTPDVLRQIRQNYPSTFCLHDGDGFGPLCMDADFLGGSAMELFAYPLDRPPTATGVPQMPQIRADQIAAYVFTSGTTGTPLPHAKTWGSLVASARAEACALAIEAQPWALVGTVPSQHMYGFESLILLTLQGKATLWRGHPFYPADIDVAVESMLRPRMLVTTPTHLRVLLADGAGRAGVDKILSATALLPADIARQAEKTLGAPLYEIYGATETGQIASRCSLASRHWRLFPGVQIQTRADGCQVHGGHVLQPTPLTDKIEMVDAEHFDLIGRSSDMVNIAGKRSSLAFLNHALLSIAGVADGCMFVPDAPPTADHESAVFPDSSRLCAIVAAPQLDAARILRELRKQIDPAFLPRPIIFVTSLPRNATGKIPRGALLELLGQHQLPARKSLK